MARIYHRIIRALMLLSLAVLPGSFIECDLEDGELDIDLDEIGFDFDDDEGCCIDVWYDWGDPCCY